MVLAGGWAEWETGIIKGKKTMICEERLKQLSLFNSEKVHIKGRHDNITYRKDSSQVFTVCCRKDKKKSA